MSVSPQARQDLVCAGLFLVVGIALTAVVMSGPASWVKGTVVSFWLEFCGLVFFMRPLFSGEADPRSRSRMRVPVMLGRMLGVFVLVMVPVVVVRQFAAGMEWQDLPLVAYRWIVLPAAIGCVACLLGFLFRMLSKKMGD